MPLNKKTIKKQKLDALTIQRFLVDAKHNLEITRKFKTNDAKLYFAYMALIRTGVTLMPKLNHEIEDEDKYDKIILNNLSKILNKKYIKNMSQKMRQKVNETFFGDGQVSRLELSKYLEFVSKVIKEAEKYHIRTKTLIFN